MKSKSIGFVFSACWLAGMLPAPCQAGKSLSVLEYLGERASRMAGQLPAVPQDVQSWERRRRRVLQDLSNVLGLPDREPMKAAVTGHSQEGDLIIEDVMYLWAERAFVSGNVVRSKQAKGRRPGIVVPPGWLGRLNQDCYKNFVYHMARKGYVVLFIDDPHVGKRQAPYAGLYALGSAAGTQVMGIQVFDTLRGFDYMLTRPDVDPGRIGVAGLCQGSEQAWLGGALESRFQFVVPVCGTTTYEGWARMPAFEGVALSDPSPYVWNILRHTDWDEVNACIAPRPVLIASNSGDNWWPVPGYRKVVKTLEKTFRIYGADGRFRHIRDLRSHDMTPYIPEIAPWIEAQMKRLPASDAAAVACRKPEDPDFSMLRYLQRRIARQTASFPADFSSTSAWEAYREEIVSWLNEACDLRSMRPAAGKVIAVSEKNGTVVETLDLPLDVDFSCPALLVHKAGEARHNRAAVILSHDDRQCMSSPEIVEAAGSLAAMGYWVIVPEHASLNPQSLRPVNSRKLVSFYGAADTVGLAPLAFRVADDTAAFRYLLSRPEVDKGRIVVAGLGIGGIDACLASVLENRIAGTASVGATTVRDWAEQVAPKLHTFARIMPYLPSILAKTDLDYLYAAIAPRPLLLARLGNSRWPKSGFEHVAATARGVYRLQGSDGTLLAVATGELTEKREKGTPGGVLKQLIAAARALVPTPPPSACKPSRWTSPRAATRWAGNIISAVTPATRPGRETPEWCNMTMPRGIR